MELDKPNNKDSPYYQDFIRTIWLEFGHEKDLKQDGFCWRSWETETGADNE